MKKISIILPLILLGSFLFYWFQLRTTQIRKQCYKDTEIWKKERNDAPGEPKFTSGDVNNYFRTCMIRNGLPPESILVNIR